MDHYWTNVVDRWPYKLGNNYIFYLRLLYEKSLVYTILFLIGLCFTVITVKYIINYVNRPQISIKICRITEFDSSGLMVEDVNEKKSFYSIGKLNELDIRDEGNK